MEGEGRDDLGLVGVARIDQDDPLGGGDVGQRPELIDRAGPAHAHAPARQRDQLGEGLLAGRRRQRHMAGDEPEHLGVLDGHGAQADGVRRDEGVQTRGRGAPQTLDPAPHLPADRLADSLQQVVVDEGFARGRQVQVLGVGNHAHEVGPVGGQALGRTGDEHALDADRVPGLRGGGGPPHDGDRPVQPGGGHVEVEQVEGLGAEFVRAPLHRLAAGHLPGASAAAVIGDGAVVGAHLDIDRQQVAELLDQGAHRLRGQPVLAGQGAQGDGGARLAGRVGGGVGDRFDGVGAVGPSSPAHGRRG